METGWRVEMIIVGELRNLTSEDERLDLMHGVRDKRLIRLHAQHRQLRDRSVRLTFPLHSPSRREHGV